MYNEIDENEIYKIACMNNISLPWHPNGFVKRIGYYIDGNVSMLYVFDIIKIDGKHKITNIAHYILNDCEYTNKVIATFKTAGSGASYRKTDIDIIINRCYFNMFNYSMGKFKNFDFNGSVKIDVRIKSNNKFVTYYTINNDRNNDYDKIKFNKKQSNKKDKKNSNKKNSSTTNKKSGTDDRHIDSKTSDAAKNGQNNSNETNINVSNTYNKTDANNTHESKISEFTDELFENVVSTIGINKVKFNKTKNAEKTMISYNNSCIVVYEFYPLKGRSGCKISMFYNEVNEEVKDMICSIVDNLKSIETTNTTVLMSMPNDDFKALNMSEEDFNKIGFTRYNKTNNSKMFFTCKF